MEDRGDNFKPKTALQDVTDGKAPRYDVVKESRRSLIESWVTAWPMVILTTLILAAFAWQWWRRFNGDESMGIGWGGLSAQALRSGQWWTPVSSMFLHGGIAHIFFNLSALGAFGAMTCQWLGLDLRGGLKFFVLYLVCGLVGDGVYLAFHSQGLAPMIGASGAIFGLWGAVARMTPTGRPAPIFSRQVWLQTRSAIVSNLIIVAIFVLPNLLMGGGFGGIAWEAHLGGYVAGLLLVGLPLFQPRRAQPGPWDEPAVG
ncbi:MAG: Rhomboid family protein [Caulobacter sp.]|nr:Rhomboid family protein [Caulobacter sp.]